jgi:hypothetical protein
MALGHCQKWVSFVTVLPLVFVHFSHTFVDKRLCLRTAPKTAKATTSFGWRSHFEVVAPKQAAQSHASTLDCVVRISAVRRVIEPAHGFIHEIAMTTTSQMPPMMPR